jgi:hypothetical protein
MTSARLTQRLERLSEITGCTPEALAHSGITVIAALEQAICERDRARERVGQLEYGVAAARGVLVAT